MYCGVLPPSFALPLLAGCASHNDIHRRVKHRKCSKKYCCLPLFPIIFYAFCPSLYFLPKSAGTSPQARVFHFSRGMSSH